jgi:hypothetical protein
VVCGLQAGAVHRVESLEAELEDAVPKREYQLLAKVSPLPLDTMRGPKLKDGWEKGMSESGAPHAPGVIDQPPDGLACCVDVSACRNWSWCGTTI